MNEVAARKHAAEQLPPKDIPRTYYDFEHYVSKERMITYWHQVNEVLAKNPDRILEVGVGNRIVSGALGAFGIATTTADINPGLKPDVVTPIGELDKHFQPRQFPFVLCARVLQHLPFAEFEPCVQKLHYVTGQYLLLTLPVETFRVYVRLRATGTRPRVWSIPLPLFIKKLLSRGRSAGDDERRQNFWKIGRGRDTSMNAVREVLRRYFVIERAYQVPEDMSHAFFLLRRN